MKEAFLGFRWFDVVVSKMLDVAALLAFLVPFFTRATPPAQKENSPVADSEFIFKGSASKRLGAAKEFFNS